jgi:hypothetical protein
MLAFHCGQRKQREKSSARFVKYAAAIWTESSNCTPENHVDRLRGKDTLPL